MRQLKLEEGGRPLANDDFQALQDDLTYATTALLQELPPHVVANCKVVYRGGDLYDISYGIVWMAGQLLKFDGISGITMPAEIVLDVVATYDERPYQTGGTKPCIVEQRTAARAATEESVPKVAFNFQGAALTYTKVAEARFRSIGEVQAMASVVADDYDNTGRGRLGTVSYGWALCDGQEGRADLRGRFIVGRHPEAPDYDTIGKTGGAETVTLTIAQIPPHTHTTYANRAVKDGDNGNNRWVMEPAQRDSFASASAGGGQAHENRPPFYVLAYRQWIGF